MWLALPYLAPLLRVTRAGAADASPCAQVLSYTESLAFRTPDAYKKAASASEWSQLAWLPASATSWSESFSKQLGRLTSAVPPPPPPRLQVGGAALIGPSPTTCCAGTEQWPSPSAQALASSRAPSALAHKSTPAFPPQSFSGTLETYIVDSGLVSATPYLTYAAVAAPDATDVQAVSSLTRYADGLVYNVTQLPDMRPPVREAWSDIVATAIVSGAVLAAAVLVHLGEHRAPLALADITDVRCRFAAAYNRSPYLDDK